MKKFISILSFAAIIAIVITACKSKPITVTSPVQYEDTAGLAQFQNWKAMNERADFEEYQAWKRGEATPVAAAPVAKTTRRTNSTSGTMTSSSTNTAKTTTQKKGWSKAAKYAAIGGGSGAVLGAVINKRNRVAGGIFGGILGGGLGYVLGHSQDKKDGRY